MRTEGEVKDEVRRMALFGSGVAEMTVQRADRIVKELVKVGDVKRKQASSMVKELVETGKANRQELTRLEITEIKNGS